jgi:hypothetical protein
MGLESVFPGEELFFRQLVDLADLLDRDLTAIHCDDDRGLTTYYPSAGVRRWQTFPNRLHWPQINVLAAINPMAIRMTGSDVTSAKM